MPEAEVTLFHQTENSDPILETGLKTGFTPPDHFKVWNPKIDSYRPKWLIGKGIDRSSVYAYHSLRRGIGLKGASEQFVEYDEGELREDFRFNFSRYPEYSDVTEDEFVQIWKNPSFLQKQFPGKVLSFPVDPDKCYVGDMEIMNDIGRSIQSGIEEEVAVKMCAKKYWDSVITLREFLENYEQHEDSSIPHKLKPKTLSRSAIIRRTASAVRHALGKKATPNMPPKIITPEVLVPYDIEPDKISIVSH